MLQNADVGGQESHRPHRHPPSAWQEISVLLVREFLEDGFVKTNSAFEIFERKIFVR